MPLKPKGNFRKKLHPDALKFSSSLNVDKKLYQEDIDGSIAHAKMLSKKKIISKTDANKIVKALNEIRNEISSGKLQFELSSDEQNRFSADDIHMAIEKRLIEITGIAGEKLHTARSRNDQIALDERLYLRSNNRIIIKLITELQKTLLGKAEKYIELIVPGYTHLQQAQPILLSHHLLAYISMLERDKERLYDCGKRVNLSPLGAGALAGTSFPIDRRYTAKLLGFDGIIHNSLDAVSDRDVLIEFISASAIIMMHLSRFAEELIIWNSQEWSFITIGDEFTTGSSMMPQKKNPDIAELIRGKTGRLYGSLITLLTVMKGLPLAYNRDMQEDKEPLFDSVKTVSGCLDILAKMLKKVEFPREVSSGNNMSDQFLTTDIADYLVNKKVPFRKAHTIASEIARYCTHKGKLLKDISLPEYQKFSPLFGEDIIKFLDVKECLKRKKSEGSTSPKEVRKAIQFWKMNLK